MSRIVYIECRDGRPHVMESGFGFFCETLTVLDPNDDEFRPYVPAADYDAAESRVRELEGMAERDAYAQASDHWHDEAERLRVERDNLRERVRELEERVEGYEGYLYERGMRE